ncbi:MAG TPA: Lrp/AsnC family transcriptional regulator [Kiritimatiellia bacterium]|nr:Lrp/AsnC family transcriptional regulator [Kiritimatiellia bacterium]HOR97815.1 Lrp/AsnC family transcriptional regulator [Kiritimatiellia bacterium]HPC49261.1 Lrp/AsnC family transcriptional regulator [Kiritimatiellia bacterium]HPK36794.1 Lrp/AsnC family transcriptional regulator [Kiritimatiellia bacterium]HPW75438.1 Lrp/AsnC family transcriptional regulator [Kiritimatiellia bacterium]
MDTLLELLKKNARESDATLAKKLALTETEVRERIAAYERDGVIRGYQAVLNQDRIEQTDVRAVIELRIRPEREGGFDRIANRIGKFPQVESMCLMSGAYDLLLFVKGQSLQQVAQFVSAHLASLDGVLSTTTHFILKTYKDQGVLMEGVSHDDRLQVCP